MNRALSFLLATIGIGPDGKRKSFGFGDGPGRLSANGYSVDVPILDAGLIARAAAKRERKANRRLAVGL